VKLYVPVCPNAMVWPSGDHAGAVLTVPPAVTLVLPVPVADIMKTFLRPATSSWMYAIFWPSGLHFGR
jgi:hypothetical protein